MRQHNILVRQHHGIIFPRRLYLEAVHKLAVFIFEGPEERQPYIKEEDGINCNLKRKVALEVLIDKGQAKFSCAALVYVALSLRLTTMK